MKNYLTTFKKLFFPLLLTLFSVSMYANKGDLIKEQSEDQEQVTGTVIDAETGTPIPGATVIEKGSTNGTTTDFDGNYSISVSSDAVLSFSYIGFQTQEIPVNGQTEVNATLSQDVTALDEVDHAAELRGRMIHLLPVTDALNSFREKFVAGARRLTGFIAD